MYETEARFNRCFREANESRARYRILCGGAGSGKSYNVAQDFILKLSDNRYRGANLLVVRKTEEACRYSVFPELCGAIQRVFGEEHGRFWRIRRDPMELECVATGARVVFRGMKDAGQRERLKSVAFDAGKLVWIWCEEATELREEDFEILDDRLRGELTGINGELFYQMTLTFNPISAGHWLKKRFWDREVGAEVYRHHSTYRDNAFIDGAYRARMERRRAEDPLGYAIYAEGEWGTGPSGLILTKWRCEAAEQDLGWYDGVWMAQDFGYNHADCILLVGIKDGILYVIREVYVRERDTGEIIRLAEEAGFPKDRMMYCDSAEPDRIKTWRKAGYRAAGVKKGTGSIRAQIEELRAHWIVIDPACEGTLREISAWVWAVDPHTEERLDEPAVGCDDAMAALRYATEPLRRSRGAVRKEDLGL